MSKKIKILSIISLIILIIILIFSKNIGNLDELWNFNFARNIVNGLLPYKDFNIITTPLYPYLNSILLLLGNYLYVFRISYIILIIVTLFLIYKILSLYKLPYMYIFISMIIMFLLIETFTYSDYNFLQNILILLIIYLELILSKTKKRNNINLLIGIVSGLTIINKQTTGLIIIIVCISMLYIYKYYLKENIKLRRELVLRTCGIFIPIIIFIGYLTFNNLWGYFIDLTILGMRNFSNKLFSLYLLPTLTIIVSFYLYVVYRIITRKNRKEVIFLLYSLSSLIVIYPIFDMTHLVFGIIPTLVFLVIYLNNFKLRNINKKSNYLILVLSFCLLLFSGYKVSIYLDNYKKNDYSIYENLVIDQGLLLQLNMISNYINSNDKVIILNSDAVFYMIANDRYNKNYDLFMKGNFGYQGEKDIYHDLKITNYLILIDENNHNYQKDNQIIQYVKDNYEVKGYLNNYVIYQNKDY